jgi:hypothetical protein
VGGVDLGVGQLERRSVGLEVDVLVDGVQRLGRAEEERLGLLEAVAVDVLGQSPRLVRVRRARQSREEAIELGVLRASAERAAAADRSYAALTRVAGRELVSSTGSRTSARAAEPTGSPSTSAGTGSTARTTEPSSAVGVIGKMSVTSHAGARERSAPRSQRRPCRGRRSCTSRQAYTIGASDGPDLCWPRADRDPVRQPHFAARTSSSPEQDATLLSRTWFAEVDGLRPGRHVITLHAGRTRYRRHQLDDRRPTITADAEASPPGATRPKARKQAGWRGRAIADP